MRRGHAGDGEAVQEYLCRKGRCRSSSRSPPPARTPLHPRSHLVRSSRASTAAPLDPVARARLDSTSTATLLPPRRRETQLGLGLLRGTMLHDAPLDFIWLGVMLERTGQTRASRRAPPRLHHRPAARGGEPVVEVSLWLSLLRACYGFESFMKSHRARCRRRRCHRSSSGAALPGVRHCLRRRASGGADPAQNGDCRRWRAGTAAGAGRWLKGPRQGARRRGAAPDLTKVVVETDAACDEIAVELLAVARSRSSRAVAGRAVAVAGGAVAVEDEVQSQSGAGAVPAGMSSFAEMPNCSRSRSKHPDPRVRLHCLELSRTPPDGWGIAAIRRRAAGW